MPYPNDRPGQGRGRDGDRRDSGHRDNYRRGNDRQGPPQREAMDTSAIVLKPGAGGALDPTLFDTVAREVATVLGQNQRSNKPAQIRQFYDELVMWEQRVRQAPGRFGEFLPFIRMLNAKAAYARGREHVDDDFVAFIGRGLAQVDSPETLGNFKLFFEAFLGFYKLARPKD